MRWRRRDPEPAGQPAVGGTELGEALVDAATTWYRSVGRPDGSSTVSVSLELDELQRVSSVEQPMADGRFAMVDADTLQAIGSILRPAISALPPDRRPRAVDLAVAGGKITTEVRY